MDESQPNNQLSAENINGQNIVVGVQHIDEQHNYFHGNSRDSTPLFIGVPSRSTHLVGRDDVLSELGKRLTHHPNARCVLWGMGGIGKTAIALEFAYTALSRGDFPHGILWTSVGQQLSIAAIQDQWAKALGVDISSSHDQLARTQALRETISTKTFLIVIDDIWSEADAHALFCGGPNCTYIVTTRDKAIASTIASQNDLLQVEKLSQADGEDLLARLAPDAYEIDRSVSAQLVAAVGGLPLAVELIGAYLSPPERSLFTELSESAFNELSNTNFRLSLAKERLGTTRDASESTLADVISLSLFGLPPSLVEKFWNLGAFASEPATFTLEATKQILHIDATNIALLVRKSLIQKIGDRLSVHKVIADVARTHTTGSAIDRHFTFYESVLRSSYMNWSDVAEDIPQVRLAFVGAKDMPKQLGLLNYASDMFSERGYGWELLDWTQQALEFVRKHVSDSDLAVVLNHHGIALTLHGELEKAQNCLEEAIELNRNLGDDLHQIDSLNSLGYLCMKRGELTEAIGYLEEALTIHEKDPSVTIAVAISAYVNLASAYGHVGYIQHEIDTLTQLLAELPQDEFTFSSGTAHNNLAVCLMGQERYQDALEHLKKSVEVLANTGRQWSFHSAQARLGLCHHRLNLGEGLDLAKDSVEALRKSDRLDLLGGALHCLALIEVDLGIPEAKSHLEEACAIAEQFGSIYDQAIRLHEYASLCQQQGDQKQASSSFLKALSLMRSYGNITHLAELHIAIANLAFQTNDHALFNDHITQCRSLEPNISDPLQRLRVLASLAALLAKAERWTDLKSLSVDSIKFLNAQSDLERITSFCGNAAMAFDHLGEYRMAVELYRRAVSGAQKLNNYTEKAAYLSNLGGVYDLIDQYDDSMAVYREARQILEKLPPSEKLVALYMSMGTRLARKGKLKRALPLYQKALSTARSCNDLRGQHVIRIQLAAVLFDLSQTAEALAHLDEVDLTECDLQSKADLLALRRRLTNETDPNRKSSQEGNAQSAHVALPSLTGTDRALIDLKPQGREMAPTSDMIAADFDVSEKESPIDHVKLRDWLSRNFTRDQLELLCFNIKAALSRNGPPIELSLDVVSGSADSLLLQCQKLIQYLSQRGHLAILVSEARLQRPDASYP